MKRFFRIAFTVTCMLATMAIAAGITLRLTLHLGDTVIPSFSGLTVAEASDLALKAGLDLSIENQFYSTTVPAGRILSQAPVPGAKVRKGWQVRVTESLGPQQVTIPDVSAETVHDASMNLRRNQLDLGTLAHIDAPGEPDLVLAQTPPPDAGVDQPRVSLLLSSAGSGGSNAFVLPSFVGLSYGQANRSAAGLGLKTALLGQVTTAVPASAPPTGTGGFHAAEAVPQSTGPIGPVISQSPEAGHRANKGDTIRLTFAHLVITAAAPEPAASPAPVSSPAARTVIVPTQRPAAAPAKPAPVPARH
ncbi:MAG: PASTA domain-containing protein [Acidobacteriaceae bacterium]|nr:PASTA domain-containing protein [Acidobacteriaceae bacterium]